MAYEGKAQISVSLDWKLRENLELARMKDGKNISAWVSEAIEKKLRRDQDH